MTIPHHGPHCPSCCVEVLSASVFDGAPLDVVTSFDDARSSSEVDVSRGELLCERYPDATGEDYLFLPHYENRATAAHVFARQFNMLMEGTGLKMEYGPANQNNLQSAPYGHLHETGFIRGQGKHLHARQECQHQCQPD